MASLVRDERCFCGATVQVGYGEGVGSRFDSYRTSSGYHCSSCGTAQESDGIEGLPEDVRLALIARDGEWGVWVRYSLYFRALAAIRVELGLSFVEVREMRHEIGPLKTGTLTEATRWQRLLAERGFEAELVRQ